MYPNQNEHSYEQTDGPELLALYELLESIPEASSCIANMPRYLEMIQAKHLLDSLIHKCGGTESACICFNQKFLSGSVSVDLESLEVSNIDYFNLAIAKADNFEIYALTNGKVRLSLMFYRALRPLAYKGEAS